MSDRVALATALFEAINGKDLESAAALLHPDADWQDVFNGGRLRGRDTVRAYWGQVFGQIALTATVLDLKVEGDDRLVMTALYTVHDRSGKLWGEDVFTHTFTFRDGLISGMDAPTRA
jgi:ketosteroid isomerase-like protein